MKSTMDIFIIVKRKCILKNILYLTIFDFEMTNEQRFAGAYEKYYILKSTQTL